MLWPCEELESIRNMNICEGWCNRIPKHAVARSPGQGLAAAAS